MKFKLKKKQGNCAGCGTELVLAPGIDTYCPNKACTYDRDQMWAGIRRQREEAKKQTAAYEREAIVKWLRKRVAEHRKAEGYPRYADMKVALLWKGVAFKNAADAIERGDHLK